MKAKEIAKQHNLSKTDLEEFISLSDFEFTRSGIGSIELPDDTNVPELISQYNKYKEEKDSLWESYQENMDKPIEERYLTPEQRAEQEERQAKLASILITSGFNFDGYTITKYSGYISGDDAVQVARGTSSIFSSATNVGDSLMSSLSVIRRNALLELKEAAYDLGCNAVIGVDFDYITLDPETANISGGTTYLPYVFGVTANGNAVIIEKDN